MGAGIVRPVPFVSEEEHMFLETVRSEGLAHLSYVVGDANEAAVIDPRRDVDAYVDIALRQGARITTIFETHRNEDYVVGSLELAAATGARILHGKRLDFGYGEGVGEDERFDFGDLRLQVLETPGHTDESLSFALYHRTSGDSAVGVFTGDALFVGDVGRTDFYPDRAEEVAGALYHSIHDKILPLGDQAILYPAHGAGSVCGSGMADRDQSTLGYERRHNPKLALDRETFVRRQLQAHHYQPPYFREMERLNQEGAAVLDRLPRPRPLAVDVFATAMEQGMVTLDVREPEAVCGAYVPGTLAIPIDMLPAFVGWYVPYRQPIGLVVKSAADVEPAVRHLARLNYTRVEAVLDEGLQAWEVAGRRYRALPAIHAAELAERIKRQEDFVLLDVRGKEELSQGRLPGAMHVYAGEVPERLEEVPRDRQVVTFCGSGRRALIAASALLRAGWRNVQVCLGSMAACRTVGCPIED